MHFTIPNDFIVERIWTDALKILEQIGLQIASKKNSDALSSTLLLKNNRVYIPSDVAEQYANEIRQRFEKTEPETPAKELILFNSPNNAYWVDPVDGCIKLHNTQAVISNTKLILQMSDEGLIDGRVAGVPQDVPGEIQFLMAHYINCVYNRHPAPWAMIQSMPLMRYFLEIANVMDFREAIVTELISPLKFMGQAIDLAFEVHDKEVTIGVDPMPIMGVTAPADWHLAWAQSVAENIGSYIIFRESGLEDVATPSFRLFVPNPTSCTTYFSSPLHIIALLTRRKVREFFGLTTRVGEMLLVSSKTPDQQAAIEKMAGCMLGKLYDFYLVQGAGGLWMDEIFSPQQLMIDIEIKHFVEGITATFDEPTQDIITVIEKGVKTGSFLAAGMTLDRFKEFIWDSKLFDLGSHASWNGDRHGLLKKAAHIAEEKASAYTYELAGDRRKALDRIIAQAKKEFGCEI